MLGAKDVVLQLYLGEGQIRNDGMPYANARPDRPGVILSFESRHGPLRYACDSFTDWQHNVRAIALGLEALRKVDRYGITKRGEQYTGWKALPAAGGSGTSMGTREAASFLAHYSGVSAGDILELYVVFQAAYRDAAKYLHPDRGGDTELFHLLQDAKRALDAHHAGGAHA